MALIVSEDPIVQKRFEGKIGMLLGAVEAFMESGSYTPLPDPDQEEALRLGDEYARHFGKKIPALLEADRVLLK